MKKSLLLFVALLASLSAWADVEINAENFPDPVFRGYLNDQPYGNDGVLTDDEIADITSIVVTNSGVRNLIGIEYFIALTNLQCDSNFIYDLDVSQLPALTSLNCGYNYLSELDVTQNPALTNLSCGNNDLWEINIEQNSDLQLLDCSNNKINLIDVTPNRDLQQLDCSNNKLNSIDVTNNFALTSLNCGNNGIAQLDVSRNHDLTRLDCYGNQINGDEMDNLIESMPTCTENSVGYFRVVDLTSQEEHNVITTTQVAAARAKNWIVQARNDDWEDYDGVGVSYTRVEDINSAKLKSGQRYNLMGQPVIKDYKGIVIEDGQKIIVR